MQGVIVGAGSACPDIPPQFLPLTLWICILFQVFLSQLFVVKKLQKPPAQVSQATPVLCSCHLGEHSVERRLSLVSVVPISGTKELASRASCIVWRTHSDTFVLFPLLELTRSLLNTMPVLFWELPFVCRKCRGRVGLPNVAILSSRWSTSDERSLPFGRDDMVRTPPFLVNRISLFVKRSSGGPTPPLQSIAKSYFTSTLYM